MMFSLAGIISFKMMPQDTSTRYFARNGRKGISCKLVGVLEMAALWATWRLHGVGAALIGLAAVLVLIGLAVFLSYRSAMNGRLSKSPLVLRDTEGTAQAADKTAWAGKSGVAVTALRPMGEAEIAGTRLNVTSAGEFIAKGTEVTVTGTENGKLTVRAKA